jgi:hypothetical protein
VLEPGADRSRPASTDELFAELRRSTDAARARQDLELERHLLQVRFAAGTRLVEESGGHPDHVAPSPGPLPDGEGLPSFAPPDLTPARLRAAILRDGCMIVRGLVAPEAATRLGSEIEHAFCERERHHAGEDWDRSYYEELRVDGPLRTPPRAWVEGGGGLLVADSPRLSRSLIDLLEAAGVPALAAGYLNEAVALSVNKTTFRKVAPTVSGAWHQDGSFMGAVRSLNVWLSLSHCGVDSPGLDIVPRRLDGLVPTGTEGTFLADQVSQATAEEAARDRPIVRPTFAPGDAVIFDELCLHQTASEATMHRPRYAVESWFFGASAFPDGYGALALTGGRRADEVASAS